MGQVDSENVDCCPSNRGATHKDGPAPREMVFPVVPARMKQPYDLSDLGIDSGDVWSLVVVAGKTSKREVCNLIRATVFASNNVVDLKRQKIVLLRHLTIFAL